MNLRIASDSPLTTCTASAWSRWTSRFAASGNPVPATTPTALVPFEDYTRPGGGHSFTLSHTPRRTSLNKTLERYLRLCHSQTTSSLVAGTTIRSEEHT